MSKSKGKESGLGGRRSEVDDRRDVWIALEHLNGVASRAHRAMGYFSAELEIAERMGEPDLISALKKMIAYETMTQASICTVANWHRVISAANKSAGDVIKTIAACETRKPLLRDPEIEMPDDEIAVCVALKDNDERPMTVAFHSENVWQETDGSQMVIRKEMIVGWCHLHEAAEVLKSAMREVRHG